MQQRPIGNSTTPAPGSPERAKAVTSVPASSRRPAFSRAGGGTSPSTPPKSNQVDNRRQRAAREPTHGLTPADYAEFHARSVRVRSRIRNILLASPSFPRFYTDVLHRYAPNSNEARILRPHYQQIREKVNAIMSQKGTCTHIKVTGIRCGSPALKGEQFCYFHQNAHRGVSRPKQSRLHPIALIEDEESIQYALMEVMNALMRNTIDLKRATLILRALHIAVKNASRVKYHEGAKDMVTQIPAYQLPTEEHDELAREADLPAVAEIPYKPVAPNDPHFWEYQAEGARVLRREAEERKAAAQAAVEARAREEARKYWEQEKAAEAKTRAEAKESEPAAPTIHVGTAAIGCPAKPQASMPTADAVTRPAAPAILPHDFKQTLDLASQEKSPRSASLASKPARATSASPRKPPMSSTPNPKEQKRAASAAKNG